MADQGWERACSRRPRLGLPVWSTDLEHQPDNGLGRGPDAPAWLIKGGSEPAREGPGSVYRSGVQPLSTSRMMVWVAAS